MGAAVVVMVIQSTYPIADYNIGRNEAWIFFATDIAKPTSKAAISERYFGASRGENNTHHYSLAFTTRRQWFV